MDIHTAQEWEQEVGSQLRRIRLQQNIDQRVLAKKAGISVTAIKNLEGGKGTTLKSFVRVLRALGRVEWLNTLGPEISISPIQMLKMKKATRVRASSPKRNTRKGKTVA